MLSNMTFNMGKIISKEKKNNSDKRIVIGKIVANNNFNNNINKLKEILTINFEPKNNIYKDWINIYMWHKECDNYKLSSTFYEFTDIYSNEVINNNNIKISLTLYNGIEFYFVIEYKVACWGEKFGEIYNENYNNPYIKKYKIHTVQSFDKAIEYFNIQGYSTINFLKPLRKLLENEYTELYL